MSAADTSPVDGSAHAPSSLARGRKSRDPASPDFAKDEGIFEAFEDGECRDGCFCCCLLRATEVNTSTCPPNTRMRRYFSSFSSTLQRRGGISLTV
jgi:hypothetical protein